MRDEFELYGSDAFQLAPEHTHSATFLADQTSSHAAVEGEGQPGDGLQVILIPPTTVPFVQQASLLFGRSQVKEFTGPLPLVSSFWIAFNFQCWV